MATAKDWLRKRREEKEAERVANSMSKENLLSAVGSLHERRNKDTVGYKSLSDTWKDLYKRATDYYNNEAYKGYADAYNGMVGNEGYVGKKDAGRWYTDLEAQKNNANEGVDELLAELDKYSRYYNEDAVNYVRDLITQRQKSYDDVLTDAKKFNDYWSQWETEDDYNNAVWESDYYSKLESGDFNSAEKMYQEKSNAFINQPTTEQEAAQLSQYGEYLVAARNNALINKYQGMSAEELETAKKELGAAIQANASNDPLGAKKSANEELIREFQYVEYLLVKDDPEVQAAWAEQEAAEKKRQEVENAPEWQRWLSTGSDVINRGLYGISQGVENVNDFLGRTFVDLADTATKAWADTVKMTGAEYDDSDYQKWRENYLKGLDYDWAQDTHRINKDYATVEDFSYLAESPELQEFLYGVAEGVGQMAPAIGLGAATGGTSFGAYLPAIYQTLSAAGGATEEALEKDTELGKALRYGLAVGALEGGSEFIGGSVFGEATDLASTGFGKWLTKIGADKYVGKGLGKAAYTFASEGVEESIMDIATPLAQSAFDIGNSRDEYFGENWKEGWSDVISGIPETFVVGGTVGAVIEGFHSGASAIANKDKGGFKYNKIADEMTIIENALKAEAAVKQSKNATPEKIDAFSAKTSDKVAASVQNISKTMQKLTPAQRAEVVADAPMIELFLNEDGSVREGFDYVVAKQNTELLSMLTKVSKGEFKDNDKVYLNNVSDDIAGRIQELTGINVSGFKVAIEARQLQHIIKDHGEFGKTDNSMKNPEDIAKLEYVLNNPDAITSSGKTQAYSYMKNGYNRTADTVLYEKNIGEQSYYAVQAVPDTKAKTLYIVTAFIGQSGYQKGASQLINANSPNATSKNGSAIAPTDSISQSGANVNKKIPTFLAQSAEFAGMGENGVQLMQEVYDGSVAPEKFFEAYNAVYAAGKRGGQARGRDMLFLGDNVAKMVYNAGKMDALKSKAGQNAARVNAQEDLQSGENSGIINKNAQEVQDEQGVYLREGGKRNRGTSPQGQVSAVEGYAGQDQSRREGGARPRDDQAASLSYDGKEVNAQTLGIKGGLKAGSVRLVAEGSETESTKEAKRIADERGLNLVLFGGGNLKITSGGKIITARAYIEGKNVYVRADHPDFTADQLMMHEAGHDMIAKGEVNVADVRKLINERFTPEEIDAVSKSYEEAYRGTGLDANEIWEEVICDSLAGMNVFEGVKGYEASAEMAADFLPDLREATLESRKEATGPPMSAEQAKQSGEISDAHFSIEFADAIANNQREYKNSAISATELDQAIADTAKMVEKMKPFAKLLPQDKVGKTLVKNGSYDMSVENTTICIRTLAYNSFVDMVSEKVGRPLTQMESFLVSQKLYEIAKEPQCLYCYVSLDRKAFNEMIIRYVEQRDAAIEAYKEAGEPKLPSSKDDNFPLYKEFLYDGKSYRKSTQNMWDRYVGWINAYKKGEHLVTLSDISTEAKRLQLVESGGSSSAQVVDMLKYAQSASWAKKQTQYVAYYDEILKLKPGVIKNLNSHYGMRWYSFSDYSGAFIVENMQQVTDAAIRGLKGLSYTKDTDYAEIFAPTGMNINISVYAKKSENGYEIDPKQSADIDKAIKLREQYPNVGIVVVATDQGGVEWALSRDWSDVVIPFHTVRTGADVAQFYNWEIFNSEQSDVVSDQNLWDAYVNSVGKKKASKNVYPAEHQNDRDTYLALCKERGLTPRFKSFINNPNYMKLVNETRQSEAETSPLKPSFDLKAAERSFDKFVDNGGYYEGWYNDGIDVDGEADIVAADVISGKKANEVSYGRQDVDFESLKKSRKDNRTHGKASQDLFKDMDEVDTEVAEDLSPREMLANMLEREDMTPSQKGLLTKYKNKLSDIEANEAKIAEMTEELDALKKKGKGNTSRAVVLESKISKLEKQNAVSESIILNIEAAKPIKRLLERERKAAYQEGLLAGQMAQGKDTAPKLRKTEEELATQKQKSKTDLAEYKRLAAQRESEALLAGQMAQGRKDAEILRKTEEELAATKQKSKDELAKLRQKRKDDLDALAKRYLESRAKSSEGRSQTAMRHKIQRVVAELDHLLRHGNKKSNVKIGLQDAVAAALEAFDINAEKAERYVKDMARLDAKIAAATDTDEIEALIALREKKRRNSEVLADKLAAMKKAYEDIHNNADGESYPSYYRAEAKVIMDRIGDVMSKVGDTPISEMTSSQLQSVYDMYRMVLTTVRDANKAFINGKLEDLTENAAEMESDLRKIKKLPEERLKAGDNARGFVWNELTPYYAFKRIGSNTLMRYYDELVRGQDVYARDLDEAKQFAEAMRKKYKLHTWDRNKITTFKDKDGKAFRLNLEQMMSIYAYSKREQALDHMEFGGFFFNNKETFRKDKTGLLEFVASNESGYKINAEILAKITSALTAQQRAYVDEMQAYLTNMGEKGNEVSRKMWGIDIFKEKVYFPLKSKNDFIYQANTPAETSSLKNDGMTKETKPHASNPIVLESFDEVWANHVNKMSMYHGFVIPIDNLNKIINYGSWIDGDAQSISTMLEARYSSAVNDYLTTFIKDLNGAKAQNGGLLGVMSNWLTKFKKTAVAASLSVVVQQPTAILRAISEIDAKYFAHLPKKETLNAKWSKIQKYAPVAILKDIGGFDAGSGKQMTEWLNADTRQGLEKAMNKVDDLTMYGAALGDRIGWGAIWAAVEREVQAKQKLQYGTEEFWQACGKRFTDIIVRTQVYDSTLSRSGFMRGKDGLLKMATAFMGEPTLSINMLADAILQGKRGTMKRGQVARTVAAVYTATVAAAIFKSFVYALRDDDEDESYAEKYLQAFGGSILNDINPLSMLPIFRDVVSILDGWEVERTDMAIVQDLYNAFTALSSENKTPWRKFEDLAGALGAVAGVPAKNLLRTMREMYNSLNDTFDGISGGDLGGAFIEGITGEEKSKHQTLYEALIRGEKQRISVLRDGYKTDEDYMTAVRSALRKYDPRIKKAAQALLDGDLLTRNEIMLDILKEGVFDKTTVDKAIDAEAQAIKAKENENNATEKEEDAGEGSIYSSGDINVAFNYGSYDLALEIITELVDIKVEQKVKEAKDKAEDRGEFFDEDEAREEAEYEAATSLRSVMTKYWKPKYQQAYASGDSAEMNRIEDILYTSGLYEYKSGKTIDDVLEDWIDSYEE